MLKQFQTSPSACTFLMLNLHIVITEWHKMHHYYVVWYDANRNNDIALKVCLAFF